MAGLLFWTTTKRSPERISVQEEDIPCRRAEDGKGKGANSGQYDISDGGGGKVEDNHKDDQYI